jgi:hypothetical protein
VFILTIVLLATLFLAVHQTSASSNRETVAIFHFTHKPLLGGDIRITFTGGGQSLVSRQQALPLFDPVVPLDVSFPEGTEIRACVKNMDTNSEPSCDSARVEFGEIDFYIRYPR